MNNDEKKLVKAINMLTEKYQKALNSDYVHKPMAYALYYTWKEFDMKEKEKKNAGLDEEQQDT